jgi:NitT/TauT family transport system permease protein
MIFTKRTALGLILPFVFLVFWEFWAVKIDNPALLPRIESVLFILINPFDKLIGTGSLAWNTIVSVIRVITGFSIAVIICVPLGLLMGTKETIYNIINPFVELFRPLCPIAWIPFAMAIFKTTTVPQVFGIRYSDTILDSVHIGMLFIIFYGGFFPILLNTIHGVAGVRNIWIETAKTLGASKTKIFKKIIFPASLPAIITGIRVGLGISWMVIIAAEMLPGSDSGIGYLIIYAYELAEMDILVASMIVIGIVGLLLNNSLKRLSDNLSKWEALER